MNRQFNARRGNDAFASIRGFVYQVDLTLERWLELRSDQRLELESGEDIDVVSNVLAEARSESARTNPGYLDRLLEQVKHLQAPITLRAAAARAALCNAFEHFSKNPDQNLAFRFTTTARIGQEIPSPLPSGLSGITAWEALHTHATEQAARTEHVAGLRGLLQAATRPEGIKEEAWRAFQQFVQESNVEDFLTFARRFEWSTGAPDAERRAIQVQEKLLNTGYCRTPEEAQALYDRLFVHVFRLLSQPGPKSLSRDDLEGLAAQPTLAVRDRDLLHTLAVVLGEIETRVAIVERTLAEYSVALPAIQERIGDLARQQGIDSAIEYTVATPDLSPPPKIQLGASREATVAELW